MKGKRRIGPSVAATLLNLDHWTNSIVSAKQSELDPVRAKTILATDYDTIENIARSFVHSSKDIEGQLILKSLQEALMYSVDFNVDLNYAQARKRVKEYITRQGRLALVRQFLSLFFFNFVWYYTSESFRALAWSTTDFETDMENVETLCQRVVASSVNSLPHRLDAAKANELVLEIERKLR